MLKGFRDFVMRGNVVDLAIAVVIGAAFAKVVDSLVSSIITPVLNALPGLSVNGLSFALRGGALAPKTTIDFSAIISSIIVFVLTAAAVYFLFVAPMTRVQQLRASGLTPEPEAVPEATLLLREIRDVLGAREHRGADAAASPALRHDSPAAAQPWCGGRSARYQSSPYSAGPSPQPRSCSSVERWGVRSSPGWRAGPAEGNDGA